MNRLWTPAERLQRLHAVRQQERGIRTIRREVTQLQRRPGILVPVGDFAQKKHQHPLSISGDAFCHDYLIDRNWAGINGHERQSFTSHVYKTFNAVRPAVDDANTNRQTTGQSSSFFICGGLYQEGTTISVEPPISGSYHFFGVGRDRVTIEGAMSSGDLFDIPTQASESVVTMSEVMLSTNEAITLINGGGSTRIFLDNLWLRPINSSAIGLNPGIAGIGVWLSDFLIEGTGLGIAAAGGFSEIYSGVHLANGYIAVATGIEIDNDSHVFASNVHFACSTYDVFITNASSIFASFTGGCFFNKGCRIEDASIAVIRNLIYNGCTFNLSGGEIGVDFSPATNASGCRAFTFVGNTLVGAGTAIGVRGLAGSGPIYSVVKSNTFDGFTAGNEIVDMQQTGNKIGNNTSDAGVIDDFGEGFSITKYQAHALGVH